MGNWSFSDDLLDSMMRNSVPHSQKATFSSRTLWNVGWRYLLRHPWQSVLMIVGITLGVAVVIAMDLANASASRAFDLSTDTVAGRATHQIVAGPQGLDEELYARLRRQGALRAAAPVVTEYVSSPQLGDRPLQLLGVDPFAEAPFRNYLWGQEDAPTAGLTDFFTQVGAILVSTDVADRYGLEPGARITLEVAGYERKAVIAGLLQPNDNLSRRALDGIILADIATAQELTGRLGKLDRIDLILPEDDNTIADHISSALLPQNARILPVDARTGTVKGMTAAFRTNLMAFSLLALFVGLFLIYNTMTFSVVQRRPLFGTLRCLGVTPREIFALVVSEALIVGLVGAALGLILGIVLGQSAVRMVTQTINDLYFVITVRSVGISASSLVKGALLGVVAAVAAAALPAREAASVPPRAALSRSGLETKARRAVILAAIGGLFLLGVGIGTLVLPTRSLVVSFAGTSVVVTGFAMLTPLATTLLMRSATPLLGRVCGALGRMAPRDVINSLSRTSIAVAALMVATSVIIGVSLMIGSFRYTVVTWLEHALQGDIYISAPIFGATQSLRTLDPAVLQLVQQSPDVVRVDLIRAAMVDSPDGPVYVEAGNSPTYGDNLLYLSVDGSPEAAWDAVRNGAVIVSEPFANRMDLPRLGGTITVYAEDGSPYTLAVAGIYYDYASSQGTVIMSLQTYRQLWRDDAITAMVLRLTSGANADRVARDLQDALASVQRLLIRPNRALRDDVLVVFDRTFAITGALQLLSTVVAFIGVLSALLSLQLDKQRQFGILRAVGLTVRQLWGLVALETGLMGAIAGLLAVPTGYALSLILIYIINQRSFGWTLQVQVVTAPFFQAFAVAVIAALLAGIYPAYQMGKKVTAEVLRYE
jgi:putative ABC transport system permease protein